MGQPYLIIEKYQDIFKPGDIIIEIGGDRGEHSTQFFIDFARKRGLEFHSVDIDPKVYGGTDTAGAITHVMDGAEFLKTFNKKIKFAYLDNFYWLFKEGQTPKTQEILEKRHQEWGTELTNPNSMEAHLNQAILVDEHSDDQCLILFDDTWRESEKTFGGKGGSAIPYLLSRGYKILDEPDELGESFKKAILMGKGIK